MSDFVSTAISASAGTVGAVASVGTGDKVLAVVSIGVAVATTIFNLFLDFRRKYKEQELELKKKELDIKDEQKGDE